MKKSFEAEHQLKLAIRDIVVRNPLVSVHQLRRDLAERNFKTAIGNPLDWFYVAKVVRKLNREKALAVDAQKINERLAIMKENFRGIVEAMWRIIDYKFECIELYNLYPPKTDEKIKAANTLIKLDLAILKAEMDAGIFDRKLGSVELNVYRAQPLDPEKAARIAEAFQRWGIVLSLKYNAARRLFNRQGERYYIGTMAPVILFASAASGLLFGQYSTGPDPEEAKRGEKMISQSERMIAHNEKMLRLSRWAIGIAILALIISLVALFRPH